uniref:DNA-directed RNA polymerase subunit beta n=1 Tax=Trachelomonas volvocina TaxID=103340 RepID=A0A0G3VSG5_9EUGL|nr:RNA polymerase beta subunit [Trachelomonas volvocina]AKL82454.1 RNA polymerase beta subunit [Trachelomonas volvocina]
MLKSYNNLIKIQKRSYKYFIEQGFEKLKLIKLDIENKYKYKIKTDYFHIKYKKGKYSIDECIIKNKTYTIRIYIPLEIYYKQEVIQKYVKLGEMPLMTNKTNFIINGNKRILLNEITRSTGIYFEKEEKTKNSLCTLIPQSGNWINKLTENGSIYTKINKGELKIPTITFLEFLGLTRKKIIKSLKKDDNKLFYRENLLEKNQNIKLQRLKLNLEYEICNLIYNNLIKNNGNSDIGKIGRNRINCKLFKKYLWKDEEFIKPEDILGGTIYLKNVHFSKTKKKDDIDNLNNKRIRCIGELLEKELEPSINNIFENITLKLKKIKNTSIKSKKYDTNLLIENKFIDETLKKFLSISPLCQLMEEKNPLSETSHKRKITYRAKSSRNMSIREIHPSQYGKICPIQTTEGKNAGLILSFTNNYALSINGFIMTPFYKMLKGKIKSKKGTFLILSEQEKNLKFLPKSLENNIYKETLTRKNQAFIKSKRKHGNYSEISNNQTISIGVSLIPFLEHDDANRALMGASMQQQAINIKGKENPIIDTGIEKEILKSTTFTDVTNKSVLIKFISKKKSIMSRKNDNKLITINNKSKYEKIKRNITNKTKNKKKKEKIIISELIKKSNQKILTIKEFYKQKERWMKKGEIFKNESRRKNNVTLQLGKNILTGYISWEGYNFEDAIVINKNIIDNEIFTSMYLKNYRTFLINNKLGKVRITEKTPLLNIKTIKNIEKNGLGKIGKEIKKNSIIIGKYLKNKSISKKENLILNLILENKVKDTSVKIKKKCEIIKTKIYKYQKIYLISMMTIEKRSLETGDKLSGRHGNKGIISKILPAEDMPYTPDGKILDIILNPLGIPSRMNVGQMFESMLGLAGKNLKERYTAEIFNSNENNITSEFITYKKLIEAKKKTKKNWLFNPNNPGKISLFDGRNGKSFYQPITIGYPYILKLIHLVKDKITARLIGPYSIITQQPLRGKSKKGGQRIGEMEVWAIEGFGGAYNLQELLTLKSDDSKNRTKTLNNIINGKNLPKPNIPHSFLVLIKEMQCLCIKVKIYKDL